MSKISLMTTAALKAEFEQEEGFIENKHDIDFELHETGQVIATFGIGNNPEYGYWMDLLADYDNLEQFIGVNQLRSLKDMELIKPSALWVRYLQGDGMCA